MSDKFRDGVTFAIMAAELEQAHQALAGIWSVWFAWTVKDIADVSDFEAAMAKGLSCLPPSYRTAEMPDAIPYRGQVFEAGAPPAKVVTKARARRRGDVEEAKVVPVVESAWNGAYTQEMTEEFSAAQREGQGRDEFADILG